MNDSSRTRSDSSEFGGVCHEIVTKVGSAIDESPTDLDPPLYEVIDPDALEQLFAGCDDHSDQQIGQVTFMYCECQVTVCSSGEVNVTS